jgi:multiple sugar transport system permease protein
VTKLNPVPGATDVVAPGISPRPKGPARGAMRRSEARTGLALIAPTVIIVIVVVIAPLIWSFSLAFQRVRLINLRSAGIIGDYTISNVLAVINYPGFAEVVVTTLAYSLLGTAGSVTLGLVAALALRKPFRGRGLVRTLMLLPYVAPMVAVAMLWRTMLSPQFGIVNHWGTEFLGWAEPIGFLSERTNQVSFLGLEIPIPTALLTVILFETWRQFPFAFIFFLARIQAIPGELEEAARVDGATVSQRFRHILLPQLLPTVAVLAVLRFIWTFTSFDEIYLLTRGGAGTEVISVRVFDFLTGRGDIGLASAQALMIAVILVVLVGIYFRFFARREEDYS